MAIITETYVKSLNGYGGTRPFTGEDGIVYSPEEIQDENGEYRLLFKPESKDVRLDSTDIHVTGSSGQTVKQKAQSIAQDIQILEMQQTETEGDFKMWIGNYTLSL